MRRMSSTGLVKGAVAGLLLAWGATDAEAQNEGTRPPPTSDQTEATKRKPLPKVRRRGEVVPSYRVELVVDGRRKFTGVIVQDRLFHAHVESSAIEKPRTIRATERFTLKYVDGLDGEMRLAWGKVQRVRLVETLDAASLRALESKVAKGRVVRAELTRQRGEAHKRAAAEEKAARAAAEKAEKDAESESGAGKTPVVAKILQTFPPAEGWGPEKKDELERRRTVLGVFPNEHEQDFLDRFDEWSAAHAAALEAAKGESKGTPKKEAEKESGEAGNDAGKKESSGSPSSKR